MKKFDVHVIDDALDRDANVAVCRSAVEHDGKWAPPIDDLDIYWFDMDQDHPCKKECMRLLEIGGEYIDRDMKFTTAGDYMKDIQSNWK